jgi:hypothetical protein
VKVKEELYRTKQEKTFNKDIEREI